MAADYFCDPKTKNIDVFSQEMDARRTEFFSELQLRSRIISQTEDLGYYKDDMLKVTGTGFTGAQQVTLPPFRQVKFVHTK